MKRRRPALFLLASALLGAYYGGDQLSNVSALVGMSLCALTFFICGRSALKIIAILIGVFFFTGIHASIIKHRFYTAILSIPDEIQSYSGIILEAYKKENGITMALVKVNLPSNVQKNFVVKLHLTEGLAAITLHIGQAIHFTGKIIPYAPKASPVHFDEERYGLVHTIHGHLSLSKVASLSLGEIKEKFYFARLRHHVREQLLLILSPREASLLLALMIGDTHLFSFDQNEIYQSIGAQHLLAVSGLQVTLLTFLCFFSLFSLFVLLMPTSFFPYAQNFTCIVTIVFIFWFVGLAGFSSSAIRAFLMTSIILSQRFFMRDLDLFDSLFASAFVTLLFLPTSVFDLGFLLSYTALFGILLAHERSATTRKMLSDLSIVLGSAYALLVSSIAAFLAVLPILVVTIFTIAPFGFIANFFLVPVATILQIPAILGGLLGTFFDWPTLLKTAAMCSNAIEIGAETLSETMGKKMIMPSLSSVGLCSLSLGVFFFFLSVLKRGRFVLASALLLIATPIVARMIDKKDVLEVVVMAVGQGDATLFSLPSGHALLLDAGGHAYGDFDPGARIVVPTLRQKGIKKLDVLIISHPDPDHTKGAFAVIDEIPIKEIWHNGSSPSHPLQKQLIEKAHLKNIVVKSPKDLLGSHIFGTTEVQILAPQPFSDEDNFSELSTNDNSLVVRIIHDKHALLWPGDIEYFGEKLLLESNTQLSAHILKAPHHGSKTSSSLEFINSVNPDYVIYSTGKNNRFKLPHQEVVKHYEKRGVKALNTAADGEIIITIGKDKILFNAYRMPFKEKT